MSTSRSVQIAAGDHRLDADVTVPDGARGVVVFAHGSGSSRHSPRNRYVAGVLVEAGLATVLADLLTPAEEQIDLRTRSLRFDIPFLAARVASVVDWVTGQPELARLPVGLFGASTGAAAALVAAAARPDQVRAVVSRGGRPDLAEPDLGRVRCPVLLLVGDRDLTVLDLNRRAQRQLTAADNSLELVAGAGHLFEEPGALEEVARQAASWFQRHVAAPA